VSSLIVYLLFEMNQSLIVQFASIGRSLFGQFIYFDANNKSQSGKWIPLSKDTGHLK
jgi:hypothetical protein